MLYSNSIKLKNISDNLLLEILTILTDKAGTKIYKTWAAKEKADYLFMLEHDFSITELPEFDWRKAYDEQWNYSRIAEALKLAISPQQIEDTMTLDQQELELATTADYEDDCDDDDDEVSDRVLELLAQIESMDLEVVELLELVQRLSAIALRKLTEEQEEEPDTDGDDDEEYEDEDDEDQE
jgi:hypothetical protein